MHDKALSNSIAPLSLLEQVPPEKITNERAMRKHARNRAKQHRVEGDCNNILLATVLWNAEAKYVDLKIEARRLALKPGAEFP